MKNKVNQTTQPLRNMKDVQKLKAYFRKESPKGYMLFMLGVYSGLRISDILELRVSDVLGDYISVIEKKTKKSRRFPIIPQLGEALRGYIKRNELKEGDYILFSRTKDSAISRVQAFRLLQKGSKEFGLENFSPHSLRKTLLRSLYDKGVPVMTLMEISNHESEKDLKRYISVTQDEIDEAYSRIDY